MADKPYKTVNLGRQIGKPGDQLATCSDVELRQLRRRKSDQSLPSTDPTGIERMASDNFDDADSYFTIHRYIPPGQLCSGLISPRRISTDRFSPKIVIPKVSRFQIAKVPERQNSKVASSSTIMPTISEQESVPLIGKQ